jgi:hypothetical protein
MTTATTVTKPSIGAIWRNGLIAAAVAAVINAVLYFIGSAMGAFPTSVLTPMGTPITIVPVVLVTVVGILAGTVAYTILNWLTKNPNRWFTILAVVVLIAMAFNPFTLPGAPMLMIVFLEVMHLVAGGAAIYFLTRRTK